MAPALNCGGRATLCAGFSFSTTILPIIASASENILFLMELNLSDSEAGLGPVKGADHGKLSYGLNSPPVFAVTH
jgi:ABC-type phosphate transport system permease subunit